MSKNCGVNRCLRIETDLYSVLVVEGIAEWEYGPDKPLSVHAAVPPTLLLMTWPHQKRLESLALGYIAHLEPTDSVL